MRDLGPARVVRLREVAVLMATLGLPGAASAGQREWQGQVQEIQLSNEELQKLDTFEAHTMAKADKVFVAKDYKRAAAEYDSFILEFPRSKAIPYALLRKARCLQLQAKRNEAIKGYAEVLDYYPNAPKYAAAALFYTGLSHWENGDDEKAMQAWSRMAEDKGYSKQPLAAWAVSRLADHLAANDHPDKAMAYRQQVAADFRRSNPEAANSAIAQVVYYCVHTKPDEPALRAFYEKVRTFGPAPRKADDRTEESRAYWAAVRDAVHRNGQFPEDQGELRRRYYSYWAGVMAGKFPDWDDFQIDMAHFQRLADKDTAKWMQRLDAQFDRYEKPDDYGRIVRWIRLYRDQKPKAMLYYNKLKFEKMANGHIRELMGAFFDELRDPEMARNTFAKLRLDDMRDDEKAGLARYLWPKDAALVKDVCMTFQDKELGQAELLRFYHSKKDAANGVPVADGLAQAPRFAKEALFKKAQLLQWSGKFAEAIAAYQQADNPPDNLWGIAECFAKTGKLDQAVAQLREVENFFKDHAPEAAMRIARLYNDAGKDKLYIAALRSVLKKYPESGQSSEAHQHLERLGIKIGGGVDAE